MSTVYLTGVYLCCLAVVCGGLGAQLETQPEPSRSVLEEPFPWPHQRLPNTVRPDHYHIHLYPNFNSTSDLSDSDSITGRVFILVTALDNTSLIVVNSKGLTIEEATLTDLTLTTVVQSNLIQRQPSGPSTYQPARRSYTAGVTQQEDRQENKQEKRLRGAQEAVPLRVLDSPSTEQLALMSEIPLIAGRRYQLSVSYSGSFSRSYSGLYKASYQTPHGDTRTIAATNFEPSSARQVFPCFDEPSMKAVFSLVVVRHSHHMSLSNMPQLFSKHLEEDLVEDHYQTSVRMSSYLLAFLVGNFSVNSAKTKRGVKVSVFAASHQINQTGHALQAAVKTLEFYEEYLQIIYPLPKIDLVALPDFESGAMENWGLVTFREASLLIGQFDSLRGQLWVSHVTAHELAHQWFGNLVTMAWWNDLWLNEGFASYMEHIAVRHLQPNWSPEDLHLLMNVFPALEKDSLLSSHPVSRPVSCSTKIREMFSVISYHKGASILGMLQSFLSEDVFIGGIRQYLSDHRYGNTQPDDLWKAMSEKAQNITESGAVMLDVKTLMDSWISQRGYPVVTISIKGRQMHLRQDLFSILPQNDTE
ncbi:hypothetical protein DPEC_G00193610 [Dallia pectoralis]|uniref:Uncharacterized protein n=1 Tax=Dallia pectoralis TaxID=75939 RepID=A0ACC2G734_DALPE|nr:hypothetical protein DPEC_G00193610 [Dallia pectoralis]